MEKLTGIQEQALRIVLDFVERWNKQDEEQVVAEAQGILEELLTNQK